MGGFGSGGARTGAGAKAKSQRERERTNSRAKTRTVDANAPAVGGVATAPECPKSASKEVRSAWEINAPFAVAAGTLVPATVEAFAELMKAIVRWQDVDKRLDDEGMTIVGPGGVLAAHPLLAQERQMRLRIEAGRTRFRLLPTGKSLIDAPADTPKAKSPLETLMAMSTKTNGKSVN